MRTAQNQNRRIGLLWDRQTRESFLARSRARGCGTFAFLPIEARRPLRSRGLLRGKSDRSRRFAQVRWSHALIPTLKETPADAVAPSHILLLRAGMIRQLGAGAYTYMPLGLRVLHKAIRIVREEMDSAGAIELLMPAIQPVELWKESGRFEAYGDVLMKLTISGGHQTGARADARRGHHRPGSRPAPVYKQLPITLYQIQTKFRNEQRPRFGMVRTREFIMKDAYSIDAEVAQLNQSYDAMYEAYCRIYRPLRVALPDRRGRERADRRRLLPRFMVPSDTGEDKVLYCNSCGYAANQEKAEVGRASGPGRATNRIVGPAVSDCRDAGQAHDQGSLRVLAGRRDDIAKMLIYLADGKPIAALFRGDHELNEAKLRRVAGVSVLDPGRSGDDREGHRVPDGVPRSGRGEDSAADRPRRAAMANAVVGGNAVDVHLTGVVLGRDFRSSGSADLRNAESGDPCPRCGKPARDQAGLEVGHVFKLGTKYTKSMGATFLDEKGTEIHAIMGCYGIGINRILAGPSRPGTTRTASSGRCRWPLTGADRAASGPERGRAWSRPWRSRSR